MIPHSWGNPESRCHSSQNTHGFSQASTTKNSQMCLETQNILESVHTLFSKKCRFHMSQAAWFPNRMPTYHHQDSMVLAHKTSTYLQRWEWRAPKQSQACAVNGDEKVWWGQGSLCSVWSWGNWTSPCICITLDSFIVPPTTRNSEQIDNCNVKYDVRRGLEESHRQYILGSQT